LEPFEWFYVYNSSRSVDMKTDLDITADLQNLRKVEKLIDDLSMELDLSDEIYGNVLVATMEATNNAIIHGSASNPNKRVFVRIAKKENQLVIHIEDQGKGFDYEKVPDPTAPENLEKINGRGIFLMDRLSDEMNFLNKGRVVELKFYA